MNHRGQAVTEYIIMFACLTMFGIFLMEAMIGNMRGTGGAAKAMAAGAAKKIADDD